MYLRSKKGFGRSLAFRYALIAVATSSIYVIVSLFLESQMGIEDANPFTLQLSPILFGILGFAIGHKEDLFREARKRAGTDYVTGLPNHATFQEHLQREISRARRYGRPVSLLMLDLDRFKNVNDNFGHQKGDEILRLVGDFLKEETRRVDFSARYGGEEFVVVMPEAEGADANRSAERLRAKFSSIAAKCDIPATYVSVSIGVADCPACASDAASLIAVADAGLLFAKRKGRNRVAYFRDLHNIELNEKDFSRLSHRLEGATLQSLRALVEAVESLDLYSDDQKIEELAGSLADRLGMQTKQKELLILASQLHDVGKVGVPGSILNKEEKLEPEELSLLHRHPEMGQQLLQEVAQIKELFSAIRYHHERWDGKGYPEGLKGEQIPMLARVVSILDAFRAMLSDRPYRPALSMANAVAELRRGAGSQFDPNLVEPFIELLPLQAMEKAS